MIGALYTLLLAGTEPQPEVVVSVAQSAAGDDDERWWRRKEERMQEHNNEVAIQFIIALAASGALN